VFFEADKQQNARKWYKPRIILQEHVKNSDPRLCVVTTLKKYLTRTKFARETRSCRQLLLSYVKPYGPVSRATISRWVKFVLQSSGLDVNIFKPHSTRSASTPKAKLSGVPSANILDKAGWKSESAFAKFYDKKDVEDTFGNTFCSNMFPCMKLFTTSLCLTTHHWRVHRRRRC